MDIKSVLNSVLPVGLRSKEAAQEITDKPIKSDSTTERDGNGQMPFGQGNPQHREPMTEEQLKKAMDHLRALPAVKDHALSVALIESEGKKFVVLKEPSGKIIRRIPEIELWSLMTTTNHDKGQLLRKSA